MSEFLFSDKYLPGKYSKSIKTVGSWRLNEFLKFRSKMFLENFNFAHFVNSELSLNSSITKRCPNPHFD